MTQLVLVRGMPGSGKSTIAKALVAKGFAHIEADMYFVGPDGQYRFRADRLKSAHQWCRNHVASRLHDRVNTVVSNTFTTYWEMIPYIIMAHRFGARLTVMEATGQFVDIHGVPEKTLDAMRNRWESYQRVDPVLETTTNGNGEVATL